MLGRCIYREENDETHLEIWEEGDCRSLWFDDVILQTEIHVDDPAVLPNPVNRAMLAHLMLDMPLGSVYDAELFRGPGVSFSPKCRRIGRGALSPAMSLRSIHAKTPGTQWAGAL